MRTFLVRRLLLTVPVVLGVVTLVFLLIHMIPGDPVEIMLGESASSATPLHESFRMEPQRECWTPVFARFLKQIMFFEFLLCIRNSPQSHGSMMFYD